MTRGSQGVCSRPQIDYNLFIAIVTVEFLIFHILSHLTFRIILKIVSSKISFSRGGNQSIEKFTTRELDFKPSLSHSRRPLLEYLTFSITPH